MRQIHKARTQGARVKDSTTSRIRASHVNVGTGVPRDELAWPGTEGRVTRLPKTHVELETDATVTAYGGLDLVAGFLRRFRVAECVDRNVSVFRKHFPFHESDHVLAQAMSLYVGGTCIEDLANLQHSPAVLEMLGACRLPDPTTAGDFLRRFDEEQNPGSLAGLRRAGDEIQGEVWAELARRGRRRGRKAPLAVVDLDSHEKRVYGNQKEGADFSNQGTWAYRPVFLTLAGVGECLAIRLRPGNAKDPSEVPEMIRGVVPRLLEHFQEVLVRGDSAFDDSGVRTACEASGAYYAFVGREFSNRPRMAEAIPESAWEEFLPRRQREQALRRARPEHQPRKRRKNRRRERAQERGYKDLKLVHQELAEIPLAIGGKEIPGGRVVIRRQRIEVHQGQRLLLPELRYRYIVTNLPRARFSTARVVDETYDRCDQENLVAQMGSGLSVWRLPVGEAHGNAAWLEIARLAWNLGKWIAQIALPEETVRWEWKRFRQAFVHVAARIIRTGRQLFVRFFDSHRFVATLVKAHLQLQV